MENGDFKQFKSLAISSGMDVSDKQIIQKNENNIRIKFVLSKYYQDIFMDIPSDILHTIFHFLPITDKRNLLRTCKTHDTLHPHLEQALATFQKMILDTQYIDAYKKKFNSLQWSTIELCHDGYAHLLPPRYIIPTNNPL